MFGAQEDLTHNTNKLLKKIKSMPIGQQPESEAKPRGFWYSCNDEWLKWIKFNMPQWEGKRNYKIELDYTNIITIRNIEEFKQFHNKYAAYSPIDILNNKDAEYEKRKPSYINWKEVAKNYKGIEICPFISEGRRWLWYSRWDAASGCIWDASAVKSIELMAPKKNLQEKKLNFGLSSPKPLSQSAKRKRMKRDMGIVDFKSLIKEMVELILATL